MTVKETKQSSYVTSAIKLLVYIRDHPHSNMQFTTGDGDESHDFTRVQLSIVKQALKFFIENIDSKVDLNEAVRVFEEMACRETFLVRDGLIAVLGLTSSQIYTDEPGSLSVDDAKSEIAHKLNDNGPGTPIARLSYLLDELRRRFPDTISVYSSEPPEPKYLEAIDKLLALLSQVKSIQECDDEVDAFLEWRKTSIGKRTNDAFHGWMGHAALATTDTEHSKCDTCGVDTPDPWHTSNSLSKHLRQCTECHDAGAKLPIFQDDICAYIVTVRLTGHKMLVWDRDIEQFNSHKDIFQINPMIIVPQDISIHRRD
jgi:hypothetical protein